MHTISDTMFPKHYDKIWRIGHPATDSILDDDRVLTVTEKLDGNNLAVTIRDGELIFANRSTTIADGDTDLDDIEDQYRDAVQHLRDIGAGSIGAAITAFGVEPDDLVLYFENMVEHVLEYDDPPQVVMTDAYSISTDAYLSMRLVDEIADCIGVPVTAYGHTDPESFRDDFDPEDPGSVVRSSEWRSGKAEGIVLRSENGATCRQKAKVLTDAFKEKHRVDSDMDAAPHKPEHLHDPSWELALTYATDGRIKKHIAKLTEGDTELSMEIMHDLHHAVVNDIFEEEYRDIVWSDTTIDFSDFRSAVAKQCRSVLKAAIRANGVGVDR